MNKNELSLNRRTFIKASSLATGGLILPNWLQAQAHISGSDAIKIGVVGCGGRGTEAVVQALSTAQNVQLVALGDVFRDRLDSCLKKVRDKQYKNAAGESITSAECVEVPEEHKFTGFDAYQKVIPLVDVVILTTPPGFRPLHFEAAVAAGKHVFMEKPVATDAPGVRRVLAAAEEAKRKQLNVVVGLQRHYQTKYQEWVRRMHEGEIGEIRTAHVAWNSGGVWVKEREEGQSELAYQMRNWYYFNWICGDHITEQHIHNLDVGNWVMQSYPSQAYGMGGRHQRTGAKHGQIYDHHFVEYQYEDGRYMISQCRHWRNTPSRVSVAFQGTKGSAPSPGTLMGADGARLYKYRDRNPANPYQVEHDELFAAIAQGEYKYADAENGAYATLTSIMGRMATYSGEIITWDQALNSELSLVPDDLDWDSPAPLQPLADGSYPIPGPGNGQAY